MDIVIVSQYLRNIEQFENNNSRFVYLAKLLAKSRENKIEIITSDFYHGKKEKFNKVGILPDVKITTCHEKGYPKNICLKRIFSHKELAKNIKNYLNQREKPDVIYCAVPSLAVAKAVTKYAKKNNIRLIVDIQDLWPEAFKMVFKVPIIKDIIFYPMERQANYIYSNADEIIAVSDTYANRALKVNKNLDSGLSVFLGTDLDTFDKYREENKFEFNDNYIRLAYIGTLGHSYDIRCIISAIKLLNERGINNIKFVIMGDGPLRNEFEEYAQKENVDCEFTGKLEYPKMVGMLSACDIGINPITKGAAQSIINKVGDYAAAGLPVVSTQECEEYRNLLDEYSAGLNCKNGNIEDIATKLEFLVSNKEKRKEYGKNDRLMAEEKFDRKKSYIKIIKILEDR